MSAALMASLFTVIAAGSALASTSVTSAGTIARGTTSTGTASFTFTETGIADLTAGMIAGTGDLTVTITPAAPGTGTVTFSGTPVVTAPGSLGASASISGNVLTIQLTGQDPFNVEQITVSGLNIKASLDASLGAIVATLGGGAAAAFVPATVTATGTLQAPSIDVGDTSATVLLTSACNFAVTGGLNGTVNFSDTSDPLAISAVGGTATTPVLTIAAATAAHAIGVTLTQTVANCTPTGLGSPGTVADVVVQTAGTPESVNPGEQNQDAANTTITEQTAGYIPVGTLTFTLSAAGVQFSAAPTVTPAGAGLALGSTICNLSFDRSSCSVAVTHVSTAIGSVTLSNITLDVASTVANGTSINVVVTSSPAINVSIDTNTIAVVSRVIVGVAAQPVIYINYNDQSTGMITLTEAGAGFFQSGVGSNNTFGLCILTDETFTRAPYAVVTAGDLKLLTGVVGGTSVLGTANGSDCYYWTVFSGSTTASTIEIRGSDSTGAVLPSGSLNGPRLSVGAGLAPGTTQMQILVGLHDDVLNNALAARSSIVSNATRAFKSGVVVTAVSQPVIQKGTTGGAAGNITITETLNGQLKANEWICLQIQPRANNNFIQDTWFDVGGGINSNQLPVISTNAASGLLVKPVTIGGETPCSGGLSDNRASAGFQVAQQSFGGTLGVITISNLHYTTAADAVDGNVLVRVYNKSTGGVDFSSFVSNARIGSAVAGSAASRLGVTQTGAFTTSTKVQKVGKYITFRFDFGVGNAGKHVDILGATKTGNDWSAFAKVTGRVANASGVVYYYVRQSSASWKSFRAGVTGSGTWTPARQGRWIP